MRILFVDDEPEQAEHHCRLIAEILDTKVDVVTSVDQAVSAVLDDPYDLVITDIFIPMGRRARDVLGPRARRYEETLQHLGGLVLLDELDRLDPAPAIIAYTACTDFELLEVLGERVSSKVPKPAPSEVMLRAVLEALGLPVPR